jgi:glutamine amidotransferase
MITIIDYGLGNIKAFVNVYQRLNIPLVVARNINDLKEASKIILPGVGAFDHAMQLLQRSGMREMLDDLVLNKKLPVIGVCVGMQIMALSSEEGNLTGLGWINGNVKKFDIRLLHHRPHLPHMGWNNVVPLKQNGLVKELEKELRFYFLHSYYFECNDRDDVVAETEYGNRFSCVVNHENIYGVQFHPEKSHHNGVELLKNFGNL